MHFRDCWGWGWGWGCSFPSFQHGKTHDLSTLTPLCKEQQRTRVKETPPIYSTHSKNTFWKKKKKKKKKEEESEVLSKGKRETSGNNYLQMKTRRAGLLGAKSATSQHSNEKVTKDSYQGRRRISGDLSFFFGCACDEREGGSYAPQDEKAPASICKEREDRHQMIDAWQKDKAALHG